jgi:uncharacterized membrane protein YqgA involved in biofilm formation
VERTGGLLLLPEGWLLSQPMRVEIAETAPGLVLWLLAAALEEAQLQLRYEEHEPPLVVGQRVL